MTSSKFKNSKTNKIWVPLLARPERLWCFSSHRTETERQGQGPRLSRVMRLMLWTVSVFPLYLLLFPPSPTHCITSATAVSLTSTWWSEHHCQSASVYLKCENFNIENFKQKKSWCWKFSLTKKFDDESFRYSYFRYDILCRIFF